MQLTVPLAPQRTNLYDGETDRHRSVLIGIHTTRGIDITKATKDNKELVQSLHRLAHTRPKSRRLSPYSAIQITAADPVGLPAHQDQRNATKTDIIAFGQYSDGLLWVSSANGKTPCPQKTINNEKVDVKGTLHDIHRRWQTFEGTRWHATSAHEGYRVSVAFYMPSGMEKVSAAIKRELASLGFPLSEPTPSSDMFHAEAHLPQPITPK
eukprot:6372602-Amphidinium_carterae.1